MTTAVTAIFESPDMAELALHQLRNSSIPLHSFKIQSVNLNHTRGDDAPFPAFFTPAMQNTLGSTGAAAFMSAPIPEQPRRDPKGSLETVLTVHIPEQDAAKVRSILISAHGRQVR